MGREELKVYKPRSKLGSQYKKELGWTWRYTKGFAS